MYFKQLKIGLITYEQYIEKIRKLKNYSEQNFK